MVALLSRYPSTAVVLVFSSIGYTTQQVTIGTQSLINVTLAESVAALDEIVVVVIRPGKEISDRCGFNG